MGLTEEKGIVAMETMGGDLTVFQGKLEVEKVAYIVNLCADAYVCLISKLGLYYFDIKCMNALYKCTGKTFEVKVGDLGSLFPLNSSGVTTYVCPFVQRTDAVVFVLPESNRPIVVYPYTYFVNSGNVRRVLTHPTKEASS